MTTDLTRFRDKLKEIGISPCTGYRHVRAGKLRLTKVGHLAFVREKDWQDFVDGLPTRCGNKTLH
jgi:hypothetical protein